MRLTKAELEGRGFGFGIGRLVTPERTVWATLIFWKWRVNLESKKR